MWSKPPSEQIQDGAVVVGPCSPVFWLSEPNSTGRYYIFDVKVEWKEMQVPSIEQDRIAPVVSKPDVLDDVCRCVAGHYTVEP